MPFFIVVDEAKAGDVIDLTVIDDVDSPFYPKGKQSSNPHGMFYKPTSGIWGDVYLEILPKSGYLSGFSLKTSFDRKRVEITDISFRGGEKQPLSASLFYQGRLLEEANEKLEFDVSNEFHPWSVDEPNLYEVELRYGDDVVASSFGIKKFEVKERGGSKLFFLNDKPIYLNGLLDQGYHSPSSGLTPLNEESLEKDLRYVKNAGFNFLRKHIKVESPRWYYLCDKLGIVVMQDFVSGWDKYMYFYSTVFPTIGFIKGRKNQNHNRKNKKSQAFFEKEMPLYVEHFKNVTSVCLWCLFNEGWGQYDATRLTEKLRSLDPYRPIDSTSGWFDEKTGDINSRHVYFRKPRLKNKGGRVLFLSEFGGYVYKVEGHGYEGKTYGYKMLSNPDELIKWLKKSYLEWLVPLIKKEGLCGSVYTQLSDVEGELNGLLTYDRAQYKVDPSVLKKINEEVYRAFLTTWGKSE